jgi:nitrite reductase/ring-hydroxylating ferredoxin subunit
MTSVVSTVSLTTEAIQQDILARRAAALNKVRAAKIAMRLAGHEVEEVKIRCAHPNAVQQERCDWGGEKWIECQCADCGLVYKGGLSSLRNV